jgi:hypothetical protein
MRDATYTVVIVATRAAIEYARPLCLEWVRTQTPNTPQTAADMLPTKLSPTGKGPTTHYLCCMALTRHQYEHMQSFITTRSVPVKMTVVGPQAAGYEHKLPNRDAWLQASGLAVVC